MLQSASLSLHTAVLNGASVICGSFEAVGREELVEREVDAGKQCAGIVLGAGGAFLVGQAVVVYRHHKLTVPLQADERELTEGGKKLPNPIRYHEVAAEVIEDALRDLADIGVEAGYAGVGKAHTQDDGIDAFHHGDGLLRTVGHNAVRGKYPRGALAAALEERRWCPLPRRNTSRPRCSGRG